MGGYKRDGGMFGGKRGDGDVPFRLVLLEDLPLGVVADGFDVDEAAQIQRFGAEVSHAGLTRDCLPDGLINWWRCG